MPLEDRLLADLRALLAEFRAPEHNYWLTSACADRLEAVLTAYASPLPDDQGSVPSAELFE